MKNIMNTKFSDLFDVIITESECFGKITDERIPQIEDFIFKYIEMEYPEFWKSISQNEIDILVDEHERFDEEDYPTYSVYIYVSYDIVDVLKRLYPEMCI